VANGDRLTGLDASFLHLERQGAHMHVASCMTFQGEPPSYDELVEHISERLHLVPRYRQKLAEIPFEQGRPVWVDDPHFNVRYHVRHTALPEPGGQAELRRLSGRAFSQRLDRSKPLWEIWLVEGLERDEFALLAKTHHCLVDGVSGVDITTVLFDTAPDPAPTPSEERTWVARPVPSRTWLLADALRERVTQPAEIARGAKALVRGPRQVLGRVRTDLGALGALAFGGTDAPPSPFNHKIGPHRRFTWVEGDLGQFKAIKNELGGTVNDVVLASVSLALGSYLRDHGHGTDGLTLKAMVPVSVRADVERGALGNKVATMWAPLPVHETDPERTYRQVSGAMAEIKKSGQAVGAQVLTQLTDFAPPTIMSQAARLAARQRAFNLVVTNVPGPQFSLYCLGRRLTNIYPMVPLAANQGLGVAIMSYDGQLNFGLVADFDIVPDVDTLAAHLAGAMDALSATAGVAPAALRAPAEVGDDTEPIMGFVLPRSRPTIETARRGRRRSPRTSPAR
jgi:diacylglycerol O-acyltransferase / wax synthase